MEQRDFRKDVSMLVKTYDREIWRRRKEDEQTLDIIIEIEFFRRWNSSGVAELICVLVGCF